MVNSGESIHNVCAADIGIYACSVLKVYPLKLSCKTIQFVVFFQDQVHATDGFMSVSARFSSLCSLIFYRNNIMTTDVE